MSSLTPATPVPTDSGSESGRTGVSTSGSTPASSVPPSPTSVSPKENDPVVARTPWPASLEKVDRQCPPLPADFPTLPANVTPTTIADADSQTPDNWINRNPELVRLTGKHPFNVEARLPSLIGAGFLTPAHLHFVRNHGAVPQIDEEKLRTWTIRVHGLVEREFTFSLQDLKETFEVVTLPITLVCAGNRRKEQNVVRKSLGFNWGAAGVSTALWTGVYLSDVLEYVKPLRGQAKHVIFEGGDSLPQGPYGTSQRLSWTASKEKGMLIAWAMNGLPLEPDHGFPVRVIIPGQIGGRSVKWLKSVEVSAQESQHYLHFWDNKMLPRHLSPEKARDEPSWWHDRSYLITELNVNSAIARPDHHETLDVTRAELEASSDEPSQTYTLRGYAYSGGGRRVTRCEISLDEGASWQLSKIEYPEDRYRQMAYNDDIYGTLDLMERDTSFCWCFWSLDVPVAMLANAKVIEACAMDESMNMQPRDMYLNATSMMNNCMFRVAILKRETDAGVQLRFEHPTLAGTATGGWMERLKSTGADLTRPKFSDITPQPGAAAQNTDLVPETPMIKPGVDRKITPEELAAQDKQRPWFVVRGEVYDGTPFLKEHPGGADSILLVAGEDASEDFIAIHSADGRAKLANYHIGTLEGAPAARPEADVADDPTAAFLNPKRWKSVKLTQITRINHDSCTFRFALETAGQPLGLPIGQHVFVRLRRKDTGEVVQRAYTPVSRQNAVGSIDFLIKLYLPSAKFAQGGKMTMGFHQLQIGDEVELKGPLGSFVWQGNRTAVYRGVPRKYKEIGMICGGSGITPIIQVLRGILHDAAETGARIWLVCSNRTEADILLREELDELHELHGQNRFVLHHTLSTAPERWAYSKGRVSDEILRDRLPAPSEDAVILACGPDPMIHHTIRPGLERCGWDIERSLVVF